MNYTPETISDVRQVIWDYYHRRARAMPWREPEPDGSFDAYKILVAEIMLQQTQVTRVTPKFEAFITQFPSPKQLADATLNNVLGAWSGLGYNRRAKFLRQAAQKIVAEHDSQLPRTLQQLVALPGVGIHTAGAIMTYAYNQPVVFLETNIRTVLIHHFFADQIEPVRDKQLTAIMQQLLDSEHPREFCWALMDYGSFLKQTVGNVARAAAIYQKQTAFEGSNRQLRGKVLKALLQGSQDIASLERIMADQRLRPVLQELLDESLITQHGSLYKITQ